jgi:copper oxidase (laccase) domain-containing protein
MQHVVKEMLDHYGCSLFSLLVAFGPCIGSDCYEVGMDVRRGFEEAALSLEVFRSHPKIGGKYFLDLKQANLLQLVELGVKRERMFSVDCCSHCCENFPSYRGHRGKEARSINFIGLKS